MKSAYRGMTHLIALLVVVQTAAIAFGAFGLIKYIEGGGVVTKDTIDDVDYTGSVGFPIHSVTGEMLVPLAAILLLVIAFVAKIPDGLKWAGMVFGLVVLQVVLGVVSVDSPALGIFHGALALLLLLVDIEAGQRVKRLADAEPALAPA